MAREVNMDVNTSGAWRRVASFDLDDFEEGQLEHAAEQLLQMASHAAIKARIIMPGDTAPLLTWCRAHGWREWTAA